MNETVQLCSHSRGLLEPRYKRQVKRVGSLLAIFFLLGISTTFASHFRYGNVTWTRISETPTTVTIRLNASFSWALGTAPSSAFFAISGGPTTGSVNVPLLNVTDPSGGWTNSTGTGQVTLNKSTSIYTLAYNSGNKIAGLANNNQGYWNVHTKINTNAAGSSPVSTLPAIINMPVGAAAATYTVPASDPDPGSTLTYRLATSAEIAGAYTGNWYPTATQPSGLTINPTTGQITFNTVGKSVGQLWNAAVVVTDNNNNSIMMDFLVRMTNPSTPPVFSSTTTPANGTVFSVMAGQTISFPIEAGDSDTNSSVSLSASGLPSYITTANFSPSLPATGNPATTVFNWTPTAAQIGNTIVLNFIATDNVGVQSSTSITIRVAAEPAPAFVSPSPVNNSIRQIEVGVPFQDVIRAQSPIGSNVSIAFATGVPAGAVLSPAVPTAGANPGETTLNWTPTPADFGQKNLSFQATITSLPTIFTTLNYSIIVNSTPKFTSSPVTAATAGEPYSYTIKVQDADLPYGDKLDITAAGLPAWLTLVDNGDGTATLSGTPTMANLGANEVHLHAEDIYHQHGVGQHVSQEFKIQVTGCTTTLAVAAKNTSCPSSNDGSVDLTVNGGTAPFTFVWSNGAGVVSKVEDPSNLAAGTYSVVVTDKNGCSESTSVVIGATPDTTAPVPTLATLPTVTGTCSASVTAPTALDNCSGTVTATTSNPLAYSTQGTHTITWTYTDASGNTATQTQQVVVKDTTPPVVSAPFDITVNADPGACGAKVTYSTPSATDNCGDGNLPTSLPGYTFKGNWNGHAYFISNTATTPEDAHAKAIALGGHLVTISNAAENAFVSSMSPSFIWIGITDRAQEGQFKWVTSEPVSYQNWNWGEPNNAGGNEDWAVINWGPNGTWNDWFYTERALYVVEFEGGAIPATLVSGPESGATFPVGTTTVTYQAKDAGGNIATASFKVTVVDNQAPVPAVASLPVVNAECAVTLTVPTAVDNCKGTITATTNAPLTYSAQGTYNVTWTYNDGNGNIAHQTQQVVVKDVTAPTVATPASVKVTADAGKCGAVVTLSAPATSDNCKVASVTSNAPSFFPVGTTTVTWTVKDVNGLSATTTQAVTVVDNQAPVFAAVANVAVNTGKDVCGALVTYATPAATDNCEVTTVQTTGLPSGSVFPVGSTTNTFVATDASGNKSTLSFTVTVTDKQAPAFLAIADIAVNTDKDVCGAAVTYNTPVATDNCTVSTVQVAGLPSGFIFPVGTTVNTFVATDASGNTSTISFRVTVTDKQAPYALAKNISVTLVNGSASITAADVNNGSDDACGIASVVVSRTSFDCSDVTAASSSKDHTVTLTVTDVNGNVSTTTAVVTVVGTKPVPTIAVSRTDKTFTGAGMEKTIFLGYGAQSLTLNASNATSVAGATTYAWSPAAGLSSTTGANPVFTPTSAGTFTFTVTASNEFGCVATATETITVVDARCSSGKSGKMDKVLVCHKGNEICIDASGVAAHLAHGCSIGSCTTFSVTKSSSLEIKDASLTIYPNPIVNGAQVEFTLASEGKYSVEVYDMKGMLVEVVATGNGEAGASYTNELSVSTYANGVYLVKLTTDNKVITKRIVVQK